MITLPFVIADTPAEAVADAKRPVAATRPGAVDAIIQQAIHERQIPGAVLRGRSQWAGDLPQGLWGSGVGAAARNDDAGYDF